ncbi:MAG: hypothetical protein GWN01_05490 [Nitrosopumilaceae archaeon]|nr:hypothetical protein [Nitrosopumilaceae archaeon]NIU86798.1 hypothetical protein [Nitrosopumilaceae archaeon]NIX60998.1 hypothetical protein [Nitrosopumilaceae archaeon]
MKRKPLNFSTVQKDIESDYKLISSIFPGDREYTHQEKYNIQLRLKQFQSKFNSLATAIHADGKMPLDKKKILLDSIYEIVEEIKRNRGKDIKTSDTKSDSKTMSFDRIMAHNLDHRLLSFFNYIYDGSDLKTVYKKLNEHKADKIGTPAGDISKTELLGVINQLMICMYDTGYKILSERKVRALYKLHHDYHINPKTLTLILDRFFGKNYNWLDVMRMSSAYFVEFGQEGWLDKVGRRE